ncbi:kinase-like domain-containing protein [Lactarius quietus]|nr:kinase-like domain-containing protein [Lactarius quietus]
MAAMQTVAGTRPEYANMRLVAVKRMKRRWEGGWDECRKLKEIEALIAIPPHPHIIPLYDSFLLPDSKELYFVFEPMEGHLFQLIKSRRGRPFAGGLVASIFRQIIRGLHHIHESGYFHRDMKPENILVTTTGHHTYPNLSPAAPPGAPPEQDVKVIVKLADFGLARETRSDPPYTEYVSTRWYRAPEVLLKSRDYSNPVDMWALGTIMAELVNLRPLFPGKREADQLYKITEVLGDPCENYGTDVRGKSFGGGIWEGGVKMARDNFGFTFQKIPPKDIASLFDRSVPPRLIECIADLLKYDPAARLTSFECMAHPYLFEASSHRRDHIPPALSVSTSLSGHSTGLSTPVSQFTSSPRVVHPPASHLASHTCAFEASSSHRQSFYLPGDLTDSQYAHLLHAPGHKPPRPPPLQHSTTDSSLYSSTEPSPNSQNGWDGIQSSSQAEAPEEHFNGQPMDITTSPTAPEFPSAEPDTVRGAPNGDVSASDSKSQKPSSSLPRKQRWRGLGGMFGSGDKSHLPPVDELQVISQSQGSTPSLKRTQSSSTDSRSLPEAQASISVAPPPKDPKKVKKEAARMAREAEMQRRAQMQKAQQEQSRAVIQNRNQIIMEAHTRQELEWKWQSHAHLINTSQDTSPRNGGGPIRDHPTHGENAIGLGPYERMAKARRREFDDDHSMSSSGVRGSAAISEMSFATIDSDPGPSLRTTPSLFFSIREPSASSPLGFSDDVSVSGTSEPSASHHFTQGSMESSSVSDLGSPPPLHNLSLSPSGSWQTADESVHQPMPSRLVVPSLRNEMPYGGHIGGLSPSPGLSAPKSAINPIFKVPSRPSLKLSLKRSPSTPALPPFSSLDAVANRECQPLSPMSFSNPDDAF